MSPHLIRSGCDLQVDLQRNLRRQPIRHIKWGLISKLLMRVLSWAGNQRDKGGMPSEYGGRVKVSIGCDGGGEHREL